MKPVPVFTTRFPGVKVTINDIAKLAKVSKSTISRVINNSGPVSEKTRKAVRDAIEVLNYQPNEIARSLSLKKTQTIGIILQDIRNPYYAKACWYADTHFRNYDLRTIICNADNDPEREEAYLQAMRYRNVEGILCIGVQENASSILNFVSQVDIPIVLVDREVDSSEIATVNVDNIFGGQLVVDYLFSLGHSRIAFVTSSYTTAEKYRLEGYRSALQNRDVPGEKELVISQSEELWHRGECPELIDILRRKDRPSAIFASNDFKALQVLRLLQRVNITIPQDLSLVGYDDIESSSIVTPALTTVHQPIDKMIDTGVQMLVKQIEDTNENKKQVIMKPWLVERESTRKLL
jgi:LacI family transcriptional regulator